MARHVLLVKSHVSAFTRKDGTFVAAHDDKRTKAADFHSKETDYHMGAEVRASREGFPSGENLHKRAAAAHEAAMQAHKSGSSDAHELTSAAVAASKKADDVFDRKKKAEAPRDLIPSERTARPKNKAARSYSGSGAGGMDHDRAPAPSAPSADNAQPRVARPANKAARAYSGSGSAPANADANEKDWGKLPDDDNPTYAMRGLESTHLGHIATGKVDAKRIAHDELASRGQDSNGKWIGFDKAKEHHDALKGKDKPHPSNKRVAEHMQSVGSDILSSAVKGHIDLGKRADAELANRNHDRSGNWIKK